MMDRRFWIAVACTVIAAFSGAGPVYSQSFPSKPVRLITGFPAGGPTDLMARILGEKLQATWKQPVVVEAKPGASGIVSMELLKNAPPDGYLLLVAPTNTLGVNPHLFPKLPYDPVRDFTLIARVADMDNLLVVNAGVSAKTLQELAALARSNPSKLTLLIGPAGIPAEVVAKIRADSIAALQDPGVREKFRTFGAESPAPGAEDLDAFLRADLARWGKVIRAAGIKAD
jgi:tripartite-type tricarboxylate transporter receptor subunit TctC